MRRPVAVITGVLLLWIAILATVDALVTESPYTETFLASLRQPGDTATVSTTQTGQATKAQEPDVLGKVTALGFTTASATEQTLLQKIIPQNVGSVDSYVLLVEGDRAGMVAWADSPQVKRYFLALKEALSSTFSPQVKDLVDETQKGQGRPTRNILTFVDPSLSEERFVFVRIRERLYEFRLNAKHEKAGFSLIEELTK